MARYNFDTLTEAQEKAAMQVNMFEGDFGEQTDRVLRDGFVRAAKAHVCDYCLGAIHPLERYRCHVGKYGGKVHSYHWCPSCCLAMGHARHGNADKLCDRIHLYHLPDECPTEEGLTRRHALRLQEQRYVQRQS